MKVKAWQITALALGAWVWAMSRPSRALGIDANRPRFRGYLTSAQAFLMLPFTWQMVINRMVLENRIEFDQDGWPHRWQAKTPLEERALEAWLRYRLTYAP